MTPERLRQLLDMSTTEGSECPVEVIDYLLEGNEPRDLVALLWQRIIAEERVKLVQEVNSMDQLMEGGE